MAVTKKERICGGVLALLGLVALIVGVIVLVLIPGIVKRLVEEEVALKEGDFSEETWQKPPFNVSLQIWIFNVTNADDVVDRGAIPILKQIGPYGFRENLSKDDIVFSHAGDTVSFVNRKYYFYEQRLSCATCRESDKFTIPNIPYLTVMKKIRNKNLPKIVEDIVKLFLESRLFHERPFVSNVRADELLFEGYDDKIFALLRRLNISTVPAKMGLYYGKNGTGDGVYEIDTGINDAYSVGRIITWEKHPDLHWTGWWRSNFSQANMINGSDGTTYPPFVKSTDVLQLFSSDLCRSLYLAYNASLNFKGLNAFRFTIPSRVFDAFAPENQGFCWPSKERYYSAAVQPRQGDGWCLPSGMFDISKCQYDAPIVITLPQFIGCADEVRNSIIGLDKTNDEDFMTHLLLEPTTGIALGAARKVQMNIAMYADPMKANVFQSMKSVIVPVLWINESVQIDDKSFNYIYSSVVTKQRIAYIAIYVVIGLGAFLLFALLLFVVYRIIAEKRGDWFPAGRMYVDERTAIITQTEDPSDT